MSSADEAPAPADQTPDGQAAQKIDPTAFSITVFGLVCLNKLTSFLTPYKLYFSFSSFLYNDSAVFKWQSLLIKLALPVVFAYSFYTVSARILLLSQRYGRSADQMISFLRYSADMSVKMGTMFAAILLAWPFLVYWDVLIDPTIRVHRFAFYVSYLLYFSSYYFLAGFGLQLAKLYIARTSRGGGLLKEAVPDVSWLAPIRHGVAAAVTSIIATYITTMVSNGPAQ
jgi:hypothetical protein